MKNLFSKYFLLATFLLASSASVFAAQTATGPAPSVLREHVSEWFEIAEDSPYMLMVADVQPSKRKQMTEEEQKLFGIDKLNVPRSEVPAITHVDYSARIQTVHKETNPRYYALIEKFYELTGCPIVVNTSFNVRGEPIVCTPEDAFRCFYGNKYRGSGMRQ